MTDNRISKLQNALRQNEIAATILLDRKDIYYYSGTGVPSTLLVPAFGKPVLMVTRNYERAMKESHLRDIRAAVTSAALQDICRERDLTNATIGLVLDTLSAATFQKLQNNLPEAKFVDVTRLMRELRMIKDTEEIARIREAAAIADYGQETAVEILRPGITELEAAFEIELAMVRKGHDGYCLTRNLAETVRVCGVVSTPNLYAMSSLPTTMPGIGPSRIVSWGPSRRRIEKGDVLVVDLCGTFDGYIADEARTYVLGNPTKTQEEIAEALEYIIEETLPLLKPGTVAADIFAAAQAAAARTKYGDHFLGGRERNVRFVGHGLGLELDEPPMLSPNDKTVLAPSMVLAFEPIIMAPGAGAITLENTLLITDQGNEILTKRPRRMIKL